MTFREKISIITKDLIEKTVTKTVVMEGKAKRAGNGGNRYE